MFVQAEEGRRIHNEAPAWSLTRNDTEHWTKTRKLELQGFRQDSVIYLRAKVSVRRSVEYALFKNEFTCCEYDSKMNG